MVFLQDSLHKLVKPIWILMK